jgi:glycosyltransferase involved in cell wall biosynthesis
MKKISVVVPCYNEEDNIEDVVSQVEALFENVLKNYDYEILFIDNCSTDKTQGIIENICAFNKKIKAIFNAANFTLENSIIYGISQITGDCAMLIHADLQYPVDKIPEFIKEWENGYKVVCGVKEKTTENFVMHFLRSSFYRVMRKNASVKIIDQFTGYGLYDKNFIRIIEQLRDPLPIFPGIIAEYAENFRKVPFSLQKRKYGITSFPISRLYDGAWFRLTSHSKIAIRGAIFLGIVGVSFAILFAVYFFIQKILYWDSVPAGTASLAICVCFFGGTQLIILSVLGEYIYTISQRVMKMNRPIVIEERRINFD